eukprot:7018887-Prymnesium_polylepis.1
MGIELCCTCGSTAEKRLQALRARRGRFEPREHCAARERQVGEHVKVDAQQGPNVLRKIGELSRYRCRVHCSGISRVHCSGIGRAHDHRLQE